MCKRNTGQVSFLKYIHKTSVKFSSVRAELTGAPEDEAQLTIKHLRTKGISTKLWGLSQDCGLNDLGVIAVARTDLRCT